MWTLLSCCLLGSFLALGTCLQCEVCTSAGDNCYGLMQSCGSDEDTCMGSMLEVSMATGTIKSFGKMCASSQLCSLGMSEMNFGNGNRVRINRTCCVGDACKTSSLPVLPPVDTKPNGLKCPGCFGVFSTECIVTEIACTGSENTCIDVAGKLTIGQMRMNAVLKGCANEVACSHLKMGLSTFGGTSADLNKATCTEVAEGSS